MHRGIVVWALAALALVPSAGPARSSQSRWIIRDLGAPPGWRNCQAVALNDRGHVIVNCRQGAERTRGFVWRDGRFSDLGTLRGDRNSRAVAINRRGQVIGNSDSGVELIGGHGDTFLRTHAFLWQNGRLTALAPPGSRWEWSEATAMNDAGQVVGMYSSRADPFGSHAILWSRGRLTNLGAGDRPFERSVAKAINDQGIAVGYLQRPYSQGSFAVLWHDGRMRKLGPRPTALSTGVTSQAFAINRRGQVLGDTGFGGSGAFLWEGGRTTALHRINAASLNDRAEVVGTGGDFYHDAFHAAMWRSGRTIDLGTTAGARQSGASMINNRRQVIGESGDFVNSKHGDWAHAFVWENGVMTDLGGLGGATSSANAINNRDEIAGSSTTRTGDEHAVLWTLRPSRR